MKKTLKMKPSEFLKCYKALVNLYGAILTDDAHKILKNYYPNLLKKDLYADLKTRVNKFTKYYSVYRTTDNKYLICSEMFDFDDVDELFKCQRDISYFIPETLEEFLKYSDFTYVEENEAFKLMETHMIKVFKFDKMKARLLTCLMVKRIKFNMKLQATIDEIECFYKFKDENDIMAFARVYQILNNNTRMMINSGHTPNELSEMFEDENVN